MVLNRPTKEEYTITIVEVRKIIRTTWEEVATNTSEGAELIDLN